MAWEAPLPQDLGSLQEEPSPRPALCATETNSRFQEQMCLLADMENAFQSSRVKPIMTSTEFRAGREKKPPSPE